MSLQTKIVRALVALIAVVVAVDYVGFHYGILPSFVAVEEERARSSVDAILAALEDERRDLATVAALAAIQAQSGAPLDEWRVQAGLDLLCHVDVSQFGPEDFVPIHFLAAVDPVTDEPLALRLFPSGGLHNGSPTLTFLHRGASADSGWIEAETRDGTRSLDLLLAAHRVDDGVVLVGRFLDEEMRAALGDESAIRFEILPLAPASVGGDQAFFDTVTPFTAGTVLDDRADESLRAWRAFPMYGGVDIPQLLLRADIPREVIEKARGTARFMLLTVATASLTMLLALWRILSAIVIRPVGVLTAHAVRVGEEDDTEARTGIERDDEIGTLAREFDRMMERLADSRAQVMHTARLAGRSEIATGVLHNVGNVLNSVNVSAAMVRKRVDALTFGDLQEVVAVLESQGDDLGRFVTEDPRGKHLVPFLGQLAGGFGQKRAQLGDEVRSLCEGVEHIAELVRSQQSYASTRGVFEQLHLEREVEAALRMCEQAYGPSEGIVIERDFADLPRVVADKHKLMEILVNLIQNAKQALLEQPVGQRTITLRTRFVGGKPRIEVIDTGVGIEEEDLSQIFHHGFTTKPDGHGFGLHVSANAATEMDARLFAESDGVGRGSTFVLEFEEVQPVRTAA
ncbi:MAG: HAMP domain-containing sensor histidine kinase [Planctomycetota bacterium]